MQSKVVVFSIFYLTITDCFLTLKKTILCKLQRLIQIWTFGRYPNDLRRMQIYLWKSHRLRVLIYNLFKSKLFLKTKPPQSNVSNVGVLLTRYLNELHTT